MKLHSLGIIGIISSLGMSTANAEVITNWDGVYAGVNASLGYQRASSNIYTVPDHLKDAGLVMLGAFTGFNYTVGESLVLSLEANMDFATALNESTTRRWVAGARARVGFNANKLMPYIAGGIIGNSKVHIKPFDITNKAKDETLDIPHIGFTGAAGVDFAYSSNLFFRLEYKLNIVAAQEKDKDPTLFKGAIGSQTHEIKLGVAYKY